MPCAPRMRAEAAGAKSYLTLNLWKASPPASAELQNISKKNLLGVYLTLGKVPIKQSRAVEQEVQRGPVGARTQRSVAEV